MQSRSKFLGIASHISLTTFCATSKPDSTAIRMPQIQPKPIPSFNNDNTLRTPRQIRREAKRKK